MDAATLAELLHETAEHHDQYEKTHAAHNWWDWYAAYMPPIWTRANTGARRNRPPTPPAATWKRSFMYFPDNGAGLTALTERIGGFLRRCLSRRRR